MDGRLNRSILMCALLAAAATALGAQDASQSNPYQGVSNPPADDVIVTTSIPVAKPPAGKPAAPPVASTSVQAQVQVSAQGSSAARNEPQPSSVDPSVNFPAPQAGDGTDDGIVRVAPSTPQAPPALSQRSYASDPDGDIVHLQQLRPGELEQGTRISVHLLDRLSTVDTEKGESFRSTVSVDVLQGGRVIIPAGTEIDGKVVAVSSGHAGVSGSMRLEPEAVILPNGTRFRLHASVTNTLGSRTHVVGEGTIRPDSRVKRDSIEYGGAVGAGLVTGAIVAGPAGALTGGLIGAGAVTVHLLVSHQQATLEPGASLVFQLTDRLYLAPETIGGN
jgi:hypothetical protein